MFKPQRQWANGCGSNRLPRHRRIGPKDQYRARLELLEQRLALAAEFVPGELLIRFGAGVDDATMAEVRSLASAVVKERIESESLVAEGKGVLDLLSLPAGIPVDTAIKRMANHPAVTFAEPNWIYTHQATSNDPYYTNGSLWGMYGDATIPANQYGSQAGEAWAGGRTGSNTVYVGVIDEGIQFTHPDLDANVWNNPFDPVDGVDNDGNGYVDDIHGWDFYSNNNSIYDGTGDDHGTHVTGTIAAEGGNSTGVVGVNWNVTYIAAKFLGAFGGSTADAIEAIDYFVDLKVRHGMNIVALNNSWGGGGYSQGLFDAINRAANAGILFVAAAGNGGSDQVGDNNDTTASYPSNYNTDDPNDPTDYDNVIAVAALTSTGGLASYSNYGSTTVDLAAPGSGVWSTVPDRTYASYSGTSMATPHVTGAAALYAAANPGATALQIKNAIFSSTTATASLSGKTVTGGRLNVGDLVGPANLSPVAVDDNATTNEDQSVFVFALNNDTDADGDSLTIMNLTQPANGTAVVNADNSITYTPRANFNGPDSFTYKAYDGTDYSNVATVSITVTAINDAPSASGDSYAATEDTTLVVVAPGLLTNDSDVDGDPISAVVVTPPAHGTLALNADGSFSYMPNLDFIGDDSFTYKANDGTSDSNVVTVSITVAPAVVLYFSVDASTTVGGLSVANEDIVAFDGTNNFSLYFDGSDVGVGGLILDAFTITSANEILMSFTAAGSIPGVSGTVDDSDIVTFTASSLGQTTAGNFSLYFDGSDVALTSDNEDIDAIELLSDGSLLISTLGSFSVSNVSGEDEDLIRFVPTSLGNTTKGTWSMYFDGSDVGLSNGSEDVDAAAVDSAGKIYLSTTGNFSVSGRSGENEDVFVFQPSALGSSTTGTYSSTLFFDGTNFGLADNNITAIDLPGTVGSAGSSSQTAGAPMIASSSAPATEQAFASSAQRPQAESESSLDEDWFDLLITELAREAETRKRR